MSHQTRHVIPASLLILAVLVPASVVADRPLLQVSAVSDVYEQHMPLIARDETNGQCPSQENLFCPQLCCPGRCCSSSDPFCITSPEDPSTTACVDADGKSRCATTDQRGTPCLAAQAAGVSLCCPNAPYIRCTADDPFRCVTEEGYVKCGGTDGKPGVLCPGGGCCQIPDRCCDGKCCDDGDGEPRVVEQLVTPEPATTAIPLESDLSPEPTSSPDDTDDDGVCFPADATVEIEDGSVKTMEQLDTGDRVRVSRGEFSEVFMWTHRDKEWKGDIYVEVVSMEGHRIVATVGHMLYVCRMTGDECERELVQVEKIQRGDGIIIVEEGSERVVKVLETRRVSSRGLYNPQTLHGDIVVNGVLSTCYTKVIPIRAAHGLLAPLRGAYALVDLVFRITESKSPPRQT